MKGILIGVGIGLFIAAVALTVTFAVVAAWERAESRSWLR